MSRRIGKYEVADLIGEGGFGRVYKAHDPQMRRWVAIKIMSTEPSPSALQRFRNEAVVAGGLNHPNLITVYELGEQEGRPYIVMEYLEGQDLSRILTDQTPLTLLRKLDILIQVARGLDRAHRQQVIHRDIKPANVMVLADGSIKVMDFGIARLTHDAAMRATATGMLVGSILWMAPELFTGSDADAVSDVWSYGVVAYELLAGVHPFQTTAGLTTAQLLYQITQSDSPGLNEVAPGIPPALAEIVERTITKDRHSRYQTMEDILFDLEPLFTEERKSHASQLIQQAQQMASSGDYEGALTLTRQALAADKSSNTGRKLRETLQRELAQQKNRARVMDLIRQSDEAVASQRLDEAQTKLQASLDLDPANTTAQGRLKAVQDLLQKRQKVEQLTRQANAELRAGNLDTSGRLADEALQIDPTNSNLIQLRYVLAGEMQRRERRQKLQQGLNQVRNFLDSLDPARALTVVRSLDQELSKDDGFESVQFELTALQKEAEELNDAQQRLTAARNLEANQDWHGVVAQLSGIAPQCAIRLPEIAATLARAQQEIAARQRREDISQALVRGRALLEAGDIAGAASAVRASIDLFPESGELRELSASIAAEGRRRQQEQEALAAESEIRRLCNEGRFEQAAHQLRSAMAAMPAKDWQQSWRLVYDAQSAAMFREGRLDEAAALIQTALRQFPGDAGLERRAGEIEEQRTHRLRQEQLSGAILTARQMLQSGDLDAALALIRGNLSAFPNNKALLDLERQTQSRIKARDAEALRKLIQSRATQIENCIANQDWNQTVALLEAFRNEFAGDPLGGVLAAKLASEQRRELSIQRKTQIDALIQLDDWEGAQASFSVFRGEFPEEAALSGLESKIREGQRTARLMKQSGEVHAAFEARDWNRATAVIQRIQTEFPDHPKTAEFSRALSEEQETDRVIATARQSVERRDWAGARREIQRGLGIRPNHALLRSMNDLVEDELRKQEMAQIEAAKVMQVRAPVQTPVAMKPAAQPPASRSWLIPVMAATGLVVTGFVGWIVTRPGAVEIPAEQRIVSTAGQPLREQLKASGGKAPYRWQVTSGKLPGGLKLSEETGEISGTPAQAGEFAARARVRDANGTSAEGQLRFEFSAPEREQSKIAVPPPKAKSTDPEEPPQPLKEKEKSRQELAREREAQRKADEAQRQRERAEAELKAKTTLETAKVEPAKPEPPKPEPAKIDAFRPEMEGEVARRSTLVWTGTLDPGAVLTISGGSASQGRIGGGLPLPGRVEVTIRVESPQGIAVDQPTAASNWRSFTLRNTSGSKVTRIQFQWVRR